MRPFALLPLAAVLLAVAPDAAARRLGSLDFTPCALSPQGLALTVDAQCTTVSVPENRAEPEGRRIELALAWVPAIGNDAAEDPVFLLAGGPGQSARESYPLMADAFRPTLRKRHVILLDQRGTGASNPLTCRDAEGRSAVAEEDALDAESLQRFARECLAGLDADPRHYTTSDAVQDLEHVRGLLGAERISLVGVSYGTRVAQEYMRRFPQRARAVVLDSVVPTELILGSEHAKNLEAALDLQFARCAADALCRERFGNPRVTLDALLAQLRAEPVPVRFRDPVTGEVREEPFDATRLASVVRLYAYAPSTGAMLPMALAEAAAGRPEVLMAQARMLVSLVGEQISHGMQLAVMCTEDTPFLAVDPADADTTLGNGIIELAQAQCAVWPRGTLPEDFHAPLSSEVPTLLLSGEFDPVTPPRYGDQAVKGLAKGRHLVLRGQGHSVMGQGCAPRLVARFFESADAAGLDAACLDELTYTAPFTGTHGWEP